MVLTSSYDFNVIINETYLNRIVLIAHNLFTSVSMISSNHFSNMTAKPVPFFHGFISEPVLA